MNRNILRTPAARQARKFPDTVRFRPSLGAARPRPPQDEDYPLVEVVPDPMLSGFWLYLHPTPHGAADPPRFHAAGDDRTLANQCAIMIASHVTRSTPPTTPEPARQPLVYTALDFTAR